MDHVVRMEKEASLQLELEKSAAVYVELQKDAGLRDSMRAIGGALTTPIPGTKPWLLGGDSALSAVTRNAKPMTGKLQAGGKVVRSTKMSGGNVYDVSRQAQQMGL